jgi:hypothetical protein
MMRPLVSRNFHHVLSVVRDDEPAMNCLVGVFRVLEATTIESDDQGRIIRLLLDEFELIPLLIKYFGDETYEEAREVLVSVAANVLSWQNEQPDPDAAAVWMPFFQGLSLF